MEQQKTKTEDNKKEISKSDEKVQTSSDPNSKPNLKQVNTEIRKLKQKLNEINEVKEQWYQKKDEVSKKIVALITSVKSSKTERNKATNEVKQSKQERNRLNSQIKTKLNELKVLNTKKREMLKKLGIKADPLKIKSQIQGIETKLETEVMSFEKEKVLNKQIKDLKKQLEGSQEVMTLLNQVNAKKKELDLVRSKAEQKHKAVQTKAHTSQEKHESLMASSKEIDDLKVKEEEAYKHFFKYKEKFTVLNNQLKDKLQILNKLTGKANQQKRVKKAKKENQFKKELKEKERSVEEKIKKKQKLTTEDLLIFQGKQ